MAYFDAYFDPGLWPRWLRRLSIVTAPIFWPAWMLGAFIGAIVALAAAAFMATVIVVLIFPFIWFAEHFGSMERYWNRL